MAHIAAVTGASGFVATELVKQLLEKGYRVKATVRSTSNASKVQHLAKLADALPGSLELYEADLLVPGSYDAAVNGVDFVFHVASPFVIDVPDPQKDLIEPAVDGTRNVFSSIEKHKDSIKKVILTSSAAAIKGPNGPAPKSGNLYTEEDWNTSSSLENGQAYWVSKTRAEQLAFELAAKIGVPLATILPEFVQGPVLSTRLDGLSAGFVKGWLEGTASGDPAVFSDVRDVARAHVLAAENPSASGRYLVCPRETFSPKQISDTLKERFPEFDIPDGKDGPTEEKIDNSKAVTELGLQITPYRETFIDTAVTLLQLGLATPKLKSQP